MPTTRIHLEYELAFDAAFHLGTGLRNGLIHRAVAKDASGYLYVPGSTVKGVVREACGRICTLFGLPPDDPHRTDLADANPEATPMAAVFGSQFRAGHLHFDDALLHREDRKLFDPPYRSEEVVHELQGHYRAWQTEKRTQVSIYRPTRTAAAGFLYNSEYGVRGLRFNGRIVGAVQSLPVAGATAPGGYGLLLLVAGLLSLDRIGGNKSSGAGQVHCTVAKITVAGEKAAGETVTPETVTPEAVLANLGAMAVWAQAGKRGAGEAA